MPSEYAKWLQRDVQPREPEPPRNRWEQFCNWLRYNWGIVLCVAIVAYVACTMIRGALGIGTVQPDYQLAYVGSSALPEDTAAALAAALEQLGADLNGDGQVKVQVNQYYTAADADTETAAMTAYAAEVTLIADIQDCESYFFLLEDPEDFQQRYQLLAAADGSCPADTDTSGLDKVYQWASCPALAELDLGSYSTTVLGETVTGDSNALVQSLYLGRRCFYLEDTVENPEGCAALWAVLTQGAVR